MPNPAVANTGTSGGTAQTTQTAKTQGNGGAIVPFRRATREHRELVNDSNYVLSAATQSPVGGSIGVPAYGYLRGLLITVIATGAAGTPVYTANGPFNALQNIMLSEPNGAPLFQVNDGYQMYLINKYGGTVPAEWSDPKGGIYSAPSSGNFQFQLYIPLEIDPRSGLGALPNQNAAAQFQLRYQLAPSATIFSTAPTTLPNVEIVVEAVEYDQPQSQTDGVPNQTTPPAMNTTMFHTVQQYPVVSGFNRIRLTRVGNYIRNLGFIFTDGASSRANGDTTFPVQTELDIDARPVDFIRKLTWRNTMYQRYGFSAGTLDGAVNTQDSGVFWYDLCHEFDGSVGFENRDGWWKTYGSTRLEVAGTFTGAGTLYVVTNDVAVAGNVFIN